MSFQFPLFLCGTYLIPPIQCPFLLQTFFPFSTSFPTLDSPEQTHSAPPPAYNPPTGAPPGTSHDRKYGGTATDPYAGPAQQASLNLSSSEQDAQRRELERYEEMKRQGQSQGQSQYNTTTSGTGSYAQQQTNQDRSSGGGGGFLGKIAAKLGGAGAGGSGMGGMSSGMGGMGGMRPQQSMGMGYGGGGGYGQQGYGGGGYGQQGMYGQQSMGMFCPFVPCVDIESFINALSFSSPSVFPSMYPSFALTSSYLLFTSSLPPLTSSDQTSSPLLSPTASPTTTSPLPPFFQLSPKKQATYNNPL